jgi:hypothetical protein
MSREEYVKKGDPMKIEYVLKVLLLWIVIFLPVQAGAEDLGALRLSQMKGESRSSPRAWRSGTRLP